MKDKQNEPQLSAEMKDWEKRFDEGIGGEARDSFDSSHNEYCTSGDNCDCDKKYDQLKHFIATVLEEQKQEILSEVERLQEVWEKTFIDSKKEGNNGDIWRGGVLALGELQAKLNQLKEGK